MQQLEYKPKNRKQNLQLYNQKNEQNISTEKNSNAYALVLAEKPSVAQSIAKVIGTERRKDGYLEGNGYLVSWCIFNRTDNRFKPDGMQKRLPMRKRMYRKDADPIPSFSARTAGDVLH